MVAMDVFASAFGFDAKSDDVWTTLGKVTAVNSGKLSVLLGGSATPTECEAYCSAKAGDVVYVIISKGAPRAVARKGGDYLSDTAYVARGSKLIPESTNLNTITELGTWYRYGNDAVATLTNCPVSIPFKMFVERTIGNDYITQTIHIYGSNSPEWRRATSDGGTTWGDWYRTAPPTTDSATANKVLATPNGSAGQPSYRSLVENDLPTDVDVETTLATIVTQTSTQSDSYPVTSATFRKYGRVAMLTIGVKPAAAVSTNTNMSVCTINTGYRPVQQAFGGSAYIMSALTSAGELSARPRTSLTANSTYNISYTYILG